VTIVCINFMVCEPMLGYILCLLALALLVAICNSKTIIFPKNLLFYPFVYSPVGESVFS